MAMCGAEGTGGPSCRISMPSSKRAAASSSPEISCEEPDASSVTAPPRTRPCPSTVNGAAPRPPSSMLAPSSRSAVRIAPTGRCLIRSSPSKCTAAEVSAATAGRNRRTVPALPTSTPTRDPAGGWPAVTRQAAVDPSASSATSVPIARSAAAASRVSLARSGLAIRAGRSDRAARTRARLVIDLDAGSRIRALTGPAAAGAAQVSRSSACIGLSVLCCPGGTTPPDPPAPGGTHPPRPPLGGTTPPDPPAPGGTHPPRPPLGGTTPPDPRAPRAPGNPRPPGGLTDPGFWL